MRELIHTQQRPRTIAILSLLWCSAFLAAFVCVLLSTAWPGPYNDYWVDISLVQRSLTEGVDWAGLVTAHNNAHRIFLPRLLFILDYQWLQGSNVLILVAGLLCKGVLLALLSALIYAQSLTVRIILNTLFFAALFNLNGIYNIQYSSNIQWDLMLVFSCFALYFHQRALTESSWTKTGITYGCLLAGLLSHAGTLAVLPVLLLMALLQRDRPQMVLALVASVAIFWLTFYVLPVSDPGEPTYQSALLMLLVGAKTVAYFVLNLLDSGLRYHIGPLSYYFSAVLLGAFVYALFRSARQRPVTSIVFLAIAVFCVLGMIEIAAARSTFTPRQWASSRFHGFSLLFILSLGSYLFLTARQRWLQGVIIVHALLILLLVQVAFSRDAFGLANKVFQAQVYMLSHGRNQYDGDKLVTFFHENDRIAAADPFFTARDLAWYANKQAKQSPWPDFVPLGQMLLNTEQRAITQQCTKLPVNLQSKPDEEGQHLELTMEVKNSLWSLRHLLLLRNTYYLVDDNGSVSGFVYLWLDPEKPWKNAKFHGFANNINGKYLVEIAGGEARCLAAF